MFTLTADSVVRVVPFNLHVLLTKPASSFAEEFFKGLPGSSLSVILHRDFESMAASLNSLSRYAQGGLLTDFAETDALFRFLASHPSFPALLLAGDDFHDVQSRLFPHPAIGGVLTSPFFANIDFACMALRDFFAGEGWNISKLLPSASAHHIACIMNVQDKERATERVEREVANQLGRRLGALTVHIARRAATIADELLMNALKSREHQKSSKVSRKRAKPSSVEDGVDLTVFVTRDGVHLVVRDRAGLLRKDSFVHPRQKNSAPGSDGRHDSAGVGLRSCLNASTILVFLVTESVSTEIHAIIRVQDSLKKVDAQTKSVLFVTRCEGGN